MAPGPMKVMLITANVGSIFEEAESMVVAWIKEFMTSVSSMKPGFLALHLQEVGGKNYEETMQYVNQFITLLLASPEMACYDRAKIYLDEDFTASDKFTALGALYFVHNSIPDVQIWDFKESKFVDFIGQEVLSGNIESVPCKEKAKFPLNYFPDCKWSRKGFIRTRWKIYDKKFDLINIHLFHDASNIEAMETSPSKYLKSRGRAFQYMLDRFETDDLDKLPFFIFGDFNFRLDTHFLVKDMTKHLLSTESRSKKSNEITKVIFKESDNDQKVVLNIEKKLFDHWKMKEVFYDKRGFRELQQYDKERDPFVAQLFEYDVDFPPSYPFSEDLSDGLSYMKTRCPGWCDRVLVSHSARKEIVQDLNKVKPVYDIIGPTACMGDHKPVYLYFTLNTTIPSHKRLSTLRPHPPLGKVISINGEEITLSTSRNLYGINIHDYAKFEKEQNLHPLTRASLKRKGEGQNGSHTFSEIAKEVARAESVLLKWKRSHRHRHHSSSSEDETTDSDDPHAGVEIVILSDEEDATPKTGSAATEVKVTDMIVPEREVTIQCNRVSSDPECRPIVTQTVSLAKSEEGSRTMTTNNNNSEHRLQTVQSEQRLRNTTHIQSDQLADDNQPIRTAVPQEADNHTVTDSNDSKRPRAKVASPSSRVYPANLQTNCVAIPDGRHRQESTDKSRDRNTVYEEQVFVLYQDTTWSITIKEHGKVVRSFSETSV